MTGSYTPPFPPPLPVIYTTSPNPPSRTGCVGGHFSAWTTLMLFDFKIQQQLCWLFEKSNNLDVDIFEKNERAGRKKIRQAGWTKIQRSLSKWKNWLENAYVLTSFWLINPYEKESIYFSKCKRVDVLSTDE